MRMPSEKQVAATLKAIDQRRTVLEQSVTQVAQGFAPAMFLYGPPGLGKSHLVRSMLDSLRGNDWKLHTAYSTPKALMMALAEHPATIHVFEDCEKMMRTDLSASILRAACGAPDGKDRWVTYETAFETIRIRVTGGIIIMTNENLSRKNGPMQGVASRFRPIVWTMTHDEVVATILQIADKGRIVGGVSLTPKDCKSVAVQLMQMLETESLAIALDIRLYTEHALPAFAFSRASGHKDWQGLMQAKLTGLVKGEDERQNEKTERLIRIAHQIDSMNLKPTEKVKRFKELTGLNKSIFYRYKKVKVVADTESTKKSPASEASDHWKPL